MLRERGGSPVLGLQHLSQVRNLSARFEIEGLEVRVAKDIDEKEGSQSNRCQWKVGGHGQWLDQNVGQDPTRHRVPESGGALRCGLRD